MILVDLKQLVISSCFNVAKKKRFSARAARAVLLSKLVRYERRFRGTYGEMVIAVESKRLWRRCVFPNYKYMRRVGKMDDGVWARLEAFVETFVAELASYVPWPVVTTDGAEADDVIATLALYYPEEHLILSDDRDFCQLHRFGNIGQWSVQRNVQIHMRDKDDLAYKIMHGDRNDGIPNVVSHDDVFVEREDQVKLPPALRHRRKAISHPSDVGEEYGQNFLRNRKLIDLTRMPQYIRNKIVRAYCRASRIDRIREYVDDFNLAFVRDELGAFVDGSDVQTACEATAS